MRIDEGGAEQPPERHSGMKFTVNLREVELSAEDTDAIVSEIARAIIARVADARGEVMLENGPNFAKAFEDF